MARRKDLFEPDRGLQLRMAIALGTAAASTLAALGVVAWLATVQWRLGAVVALFAISGFVTDRGRRETRRRKLPQRILPGVKRRAEKVLARLVVLSDQRTPRVAIEPGDAPLAWTTALPFKRPTIHLTNGLVARAGADELEVVLAHELTHIANRDAWVMTVVGGPPSWILSGVRGYWEERRAGGASAYQTARYALGMVLIGSWTAALALPGALSARALSRHRELAADRGAARLTGSPAQVEAALRKLSGRLANWPSTDLRQAVGIELVNFLPPAPARDGLWATHPSLERRCAQLERMEAALHRSPVEHV